MKYMREVSEAEVIEMAGESDCPVSGKEESEELEAAVCLKQFPQGYVLDISDKIEDLKLLFIPSREEAKKCYQHYIACMREFGTPFWWTSLMPSARNHSSQCRSATWLNFILS
jgi:hypothetical protein